MGWGGWGETRVLNTSPELNGVEMFVYTRPAGLIGRWIGRSLRFGVRRFAFITEGQGTANGGSPLKRVEVEANSLVPLCEVDMNKFERLPLTISEVMRVEKRTRESVLDAPRYPRIVYTLDGETDSEIAGVLDLHGERHAVSCSKTVDGPELVVRCPIDARNFKIPMFSIMQGLFSVSPHVEVETRIPSRVLKI
ncbi:hypothetical protein ERJ75_001235300 [Trypanosoma vivax]|uniref:Lipid/polyisoprenoid-binding YceI-like domain-containing protein n=1 Tax=Trypanosoma vivax (strain Y486) TaxID=1055687 RepID=G0U0R4_TRYVY|nr:hypothetical protein TRVL_00026 [Trypanosoma vivax]KAH8608872.1 hypothetical protein ERJ75_001235300 [Trypanosoma vivax]CCC49663.1 conserved hypothetical protein [Trypanosoma vivax Y486]